MQPHPGCSPRIAPPGPRPSSAIRSRNTDKLNPCPEPYYRSAQIATPVPSGSRKRRGVPGPHHHRSRGPRGCAAPGGDQLGAGQYCGGTAQYATSLTSSEQDGGRDQQDRNESASRCARYFGFLLVSSDGMEPRTGGAHTAHPILFPPRGPRPLPCRALPPAAGPPPVSRDAAAPGTAPRGRRKTSGYNQRSKILRRRIRADSTPGTKSSLARPSCAASAARRPFGQRRAGRGGAGRAG